MALRRFALEVAGGLAAGKGSSGSVGERFARGLLECFGGVPPADDGGPVFGHVVSAHLAGKKTSRGLALHWPGRRVVLEVVGREAMLDVAWRELLAAVLQMDEVPQYVVLTDQRDLRLYDLSANKDAPRLSIAMGDLPKYSEAFPFFEPTWEPGATPKIVNVDKVSKEVADLVAQVYRALVASQDRDRKAPADPEARTPITRFTLQCIVAMFAEDIGLLPKECFTTLLYRAAEEGDAAARISELFSAMSTPLSERDSDTHEVPFFNGGLFRDGHVPVAFEGVLGGKVLRALTKAAEANWTHVDPHIFGSVFQGVMDDAERHAQGAHYTAREDIMSVVGPTIVEPWRARIDEAKTLADHKALLKDLGTYRVLDPACGSGNFLYVAFRELYRLETEVLVRAHERFPSAGQGKDALGWTSRIQTKNFYGIDINPFAVELAKTTLNIAKKLAFDQRRDDVLAKFGSAPLEADPSLPLDDLDVNIVCADALFCEWPEVEAIVGNPPFLGGKLVRSELGQAYLGRLRERYPAVGGLVDFCAYWFRRSHGRLNDGGRAGLIATSGIRTGATRRAATEYIVNEGGTIVSAVSSQPWSGDAGVNVSVVNWVRGGCSGPCHLVVGSRVHQVPTIPSHLQLFAEVGSASEVNDSGRTSIGVQLGHAGFEVASSTVARFRSEAVRVLATGSQLLTGKALTSPRFCLWVMETDEQSAREKFPNAVQHLAETVLPVIRTRVESGKSTSHYAPWLTRWWQPFWARQEYWAKTSQRHIACSNPQSRPVFLFLSTKFVPTNTLQLFAYNDDYSFGIIQSSLHWAWTKAVGGRLKSDIRYTSKVWKTFPWPQAPALEDVVAVAGAAQALRATRRKLMAENDWSLRELYRSAEVEGEHPLKAAQAALDAAVEAAYGKPGDQEATEFLLELNLALAEDEKAGEAIQGPGLPLVDGVALEAGDPRWMSEDCIEPPPLPQLQKDD